MTHLRRILLALACGLGVAAAGFAAQAADADIHGAGATFPFPIYALWGAEYERATGVAVRYDPVGSGAGVASIEKGTVDFGATDVPLTADELQRLGAAQFPTVIGGVVPVVNLAGIKPGQLHLSGPVLADIYLGKIRKWDAPAIAALNPGLALPGSNITVVHRADASGTTHLWSDFLARSSVPWRMAVGVGKTLSWPLGVAAEGNEGVAAAVRGTRSAIGYVEYSYAAQHHLSTAALRNHDGQFVQAGRDTFEAAAMQARWRDEADLQQSLIDLPGPLTWPVVSASHVLLRARAEQPGQAQRLRETLRFFDWALSQGQPLAAGLGYIPLPDAAVRLVRQAWTARLRDAEGHILWPAPAGR